MTVGMPVMTGGHPVPVLKMGATTTTAYTGTAGTSAAVGATCEVVRVYCTTAAFIAFNATATTAGVPIGAGVPEYFMVDPGWTVSAIQAAAGGNLHVTQCV